MKISQNLLLCSILTTSTLTLYAQEVDLDKLSVTATKVERATQNVSSSIDVVSKEEIETKQMTNLNDTLKYSTGIVSDDLNGGYDVSIYIRGSGIANKKYGTREVMLLKDGIPLTDPLGYSDLASIDTQDIEQVEITKGPGSIYSSGTTGGVMQILTKSVFDDQSNRVKVSIAEHDNQMANTSVGGAINDNHFVRVNATRKDIDNSWNAFSKYDSDNVSLKYGYMGNDESTLEVDFNYSDVSNWLPQSIDNETNLNEFKSTGKVEESWFTRGLTKEIYKEAQSVNIKYTHTIDENTTLRPRAYYTLEDQVTHMAGISHAPDKENYGVDLEVNNNHKLLDLESQLVAGIAYRVSNNDSETYGFSGGTAGVVSGAQVLGGTREELLALKGDLAKINKLENKIAGIYLQETIQATDKLTLDFNARYDKQDISIYENELMEYWYFGPNIYKFTTAGADGVLQADQKLDVYAFKVGATYALRDTTNIYGLIAQGDQAPHDSQFIHAPTLKPSQSTNYEIGVKERNATFSYDTALFYNVVDDEIVTIDSTTNDYQNAGKTEKLGFEFAGGYNITKNFSLNAAYTYSDYTYKDLVSGTSDYSNNKFKLVPKHMYSIGAEYKRANYKVRVDTKTKGEYYTDNANTITNGGYDFVTDLMVNYKYDKHNDLTLSVYNVFDKRYVAQQEDSSYDVGAPRSAMFMYKYSF